MTERPVRYAEVGDLAARIPVSVVWELTLACDLACNHCGSRAGRRRRDELSTAECLDLIRQLAELGTRDIGLIGGEAYLRKDWIELIAAITEAGIECGLQSGGRNLSEDRVAKAAAAGLKGVGISIDGLRDVHDALRGVPGSFDLGLAAIRRARAHGLVATVNSQVNQGSLPQLREMMDVIVEAGATNWQLVLTVAMGNAADRPEMLLQPYQMLELMPLLAELAREARSRGLFLQLGNNIGYFGPYEAALRDLSDDELHWAGCSAGDSVLGIEADGTIKSCPGLPRPYAGGNVRDRSLREIWEESEPLAFTRRRTVDDLWGFCRTCYYAEVCMGGCTWTAHSLFGRPGNNPMCHYRALEMDRKGLRERLVKVRDAEGLPFDHGEFEIVVEPARTREPDRIVIHG
ncbi:MAG TPA: radical SAM protein [Allosphingosinicella sp.]|nr:radical SAM protein [Allosphingosinicella sp.]